MPKRVLRPAKLSYLPLPDYPYSAGTTANGMIYTAGLVAWDEKGKLVSETCPGIGGCPVSRPMPVRERSRTVQRAWLAAYLPVVSSVAIAAILTRSPRRLPRLSLMASRSANPPSLLNPSPIAFVSTRLDPSRASRAGICPWRA